MIKKRIYISVETKVRELNARILFAINASLKNYSAVLGSRGRILKYRRHMQKGIVIFNSISHKIIYQLKKFKLLDFLVGCLDEEGLISYSFDHHTFRFDPAMFKVVDFMLVSGERERCAVLHNIRSNNADKKIIVTGNPRIDLIKPKLASIFDSEVKSIKKKYGKFIFIPTMFPKTNTVNRSSLSNNYMALAKEQGYCKRDIDKYIAEESANNENFTRKELMNFISLFSVNFKKKKILIKPHPSENIETWKNFVQTLNNKNIIVINVNELQTNSLIKACDILLASNCTTLVESFVLKKAAINFIPYKNDKVNFELPQTVSHNLYSVTELYNFFKKNNFNVKKKKLSKKEIKILNYTIKNFATENASKLILDYLDRTKELNDVYTDKRYPIPYDIFYAVKSFLFKITDVIGFKKISYKINLINYQKQKNPGFDINELVSKKDQICKILNIDKKKIIIKEIYKGLFEFSLA